MSTDRKEVSIESKKPLSRASSVHRLLGTSYCFSFMQIVTFESFATFSISMTFGRVCPPYIVVVVQAYLPSSYSVLTFVASELILSDNKMLVRDD